MVKKGIIRVMFATAALTVASCATNGDIDDLKGQLDDLQGQVGQLEQQQQEALLAQITRLEGEIAALQGELDGTQDAISADYDALLESLTDLQNEVASGAKVHYGSVLTNEEFDSFMASESTIVTGDVVITSADQIAKLDKLALVGGNVEIKGGGAVALPNLESISGMLKMDGDATSVSLAMLKSVGKGVSVSNTTALTSVDMPELLLVNGSFISENVAGLESLTMAKLDVVAGDLVIDNAIPGSKANLPYGSLMTMDFSDAHVMGNVELLFLGRTELTSIGNVDGDLNILSVGLTKFVSNATAIGGDVLFNGNYNTSVLDFPALVTVGGNVNISDNGLKNGLCWDCPATGELKELTAFDALETIGGNVTISNNLLLEKIETFNNVTSVMGDESNPHVNAKINFYRSGNTELINVFNKLTTTKEGRSIEISIEETTKWFLGFEMLTEVSKLYLQIEGHMENFKVVDTFKYDGFSSLEKFPGSTMIYADSAHEFTAFSSVSEFDYAWSLSTFQMSFPAEDVSLCSMNTFFNDIATNEDNKYGTRTGGFYDAKFTVMPIDDVIATYASDCQ